MGLLSYLNLAINAIKRNRTHQFQCQNKDFKKWIERLHRTVNQEYLSVTSILNIVMQVNRLFINLIITFSFILFQVLS